MSRFFARLLAAVVCLLPFLSAEAVTRTWVGPNHVSWSDPKNWSPVGVPADGDSLILQYSGSPIPYLVSSNDVTGLVVGAVSSPVGCDISGNALTFTGDLTVNGSRPTVFEMPVTLGASIHVFGGADPNFHEIDINGKTLDLDRGAYIVRSTGWGRSTPATPAPS